MNLEMMKISFFEFTYVWFRLQNMKIPKHQRKMCKWLFGVWQREENRRALLMSFRNSGKSTIVGLFCAWVLYVQNSTRILVIAADYDLAKKMVRNVKKIIEQHPLTKKLKPKRIEQWAADQFTINRDLELRDPSMLAKGLGANITGLRADLIICDDVEVPKNCDTSIKRIDMREKLSELDYILTPGGMMLYIGTPHHFYTIYKNENDEKAPEEKSFLLGFDKLEIPILNEKGESNWPERFSVPKIASIRQRSGENKFLSQMMLKPTNIIDSVLNPERLVAYQEELEIIYVNEKQILKLGEKRLISASCWWDPSFACGEKADNSVVACVYVDESGKFYVHDIAYIKIDEAQRDDIASKQCELVADFVEKNFVPTIRVEVNGIGKFLPGILKQTLAKRKIKSAVIEVSSSMNKEIRIMEAFEVLLADRALNVSQKIWQTPFIEEMREWSFKNKGKDDALDAVAGCLLSQPIRIGSSPVVEKEAKKYSWQGFSQAFEADIKFEV